MDPKVSVIIATHNHAHFLPECLASVRNQTYKDYEVILVDNGSTDNTAEVARRLIWDKVKYYYQKDTGSVAGPRNTGIRLARGKYVAFLDSDDLWYETKLEKAMNVLEENPDIDILSHDLYLVRMGKREKLIRSGPFKKDMFKSLLIKNSILGSATITKRSVITQIGGFNEAKDYTHVEDGEAWLRLAHLGKRFYFINEALGEYRVHNFNLSFDFEKVLSNEKFVIDKHFKNFKGYSPLYIRFLYLNRLSTIYFNFGVQYFFIRKLTKSFKNICKSLIFSPISFFYNFYNFLCEIIRKQLIKKEYI